MPELPEVETFRLYFAKYALDQKIQQVLITDTGILRKEEDIQILPQLLTEKKFIATLRHGKFLFCQLNSKKWILIHFGMSGYFRYVDQINPYHKHDRVIFHFTNGYYLAFNCMRKFGHIESIKNPESYISAKKLGPDALKISYLVFKKQLEQRKRPIKSALLSQGIIAGVGNLYADETLFQSKIYPLTNCEALSDKMIQDLYEKLKNILSTAVQLQADYGKFPEHFFINYRRKGEKCPRCKHPLEITKVGQRTTYFCPNCQKPMV